jgi:hypothetical protein
MNAQASFMDRIDTKFLLTQEEFYKVLWEFEEKFYILEILWGKIFWYENIYMDTKDFSFYYKHQNGVKPRIKIRTRLYKESWKAFFEFKQKIRKLTRKFRYEIPVSEHGHLSRESMWFYKWVSASFTHDSPQKIFPSIETQYSRMSFVSKDSSERITIDFNISVKNVRWNSEFVSLDNLVILEVKSLKKKSVGWEIMKAYWINEAQSCSKYALWIIYCWLAEKFCTFENTVKEIERIRTELTKKNI